MLDIFLWNRSIYFHVCIQNTPSEGLFTEGSFVLVEGDYSEENTLTVIAIGHPPCERRHISRYGYMTLLCAEHSCTHVETNIISSIYGHIDFLGKGGLTPSEDVRLAAYGVSCD